MISSTQPQSFAIFARSAYGDLLMTAPLINFIKQQNPGHKITLFVEDKNSQLVEFMENIDAYYQIPSKGNKYLLYALYGLKHRKNKYDISIAAKTGIGTANGFFPYMLGAKIRISYVSNKKRWTDWMINHPISYDESIYHEQHYALGILQLLDKNIDHIHKNLYPKLTKIISEKDTEKITIFVSVSNNRNASQLKNITIAKILNQLNHTYDISVYISTVEDDIEKATNLQKLLDFNSSIKLTPSLKDYLILINSMDLCFFGDGGGMHMAAALGVNQIVLFGPTSTLTWMPLSDLATVLSDKSDVMSDKADVNNIPINRILSALEAKLNTIKLNKQST